MRLITRLFFIGAFLLCGLGSFAQGQFSPLLSRMETSLFGINYDSQNDNERLTRLEEVVYGKSSTSSVPQRVEKLRKDLEADLIGKEIKPKKDSFAEDDSPQGDAVEKADENVNYPIVNMLENEVFQREYKTMDINKRLANLEQKVFNKPYNNDNLNSRVERLKTTVIPSDRIATRNSQDNLEFPDPDEYSAPVPKKPNYYSAKGEDFDSFDYNAQNSVLDEVSSDSDIQVPLSALEKTVLKKSFPNDPVSNRLSRLEAKIFNTSFVQDEPNVRLDRLSSAYRAQKTSKKYDNNKVSQHMSTAIQVGTMLLMVLAMIL